jgi:hypothetical protein
VTDEAQMAEKQRWKEEYDRKNEELKRRFMKKSEEAKP